MKILQYDDLISIPLSENNELLVVLNETSPNIICQYEKQDMAPFFGENILVRTSVVEKLKAAGENLKRVFPGACFKVVYGYRTPQVQELYFQKRKAAVKNDYPHLSEEQLVRETHLQVAVPDVAGHPTGGAIDITITTPEGDLDMGTGIADYSYGKKIETFAENLNAQQTKNRKLLHDLLVKQNFAPFYGEWWHFSYGDREWAAFYKQPASLYSPIKHEEGNLA